MIVLKVNSVEKEVDVDGAETLLTE